MSEDEEDRRRRGRCVWQSVGSMGMGLGEDLAPTWLILN